MLLYIPPLAVSQGTTSHDSLQYPFYLFGVNFRLLAATYFPVVHQLLMGVPFHSATQDCSDLDNVDKEYPAWHRDWTLPYIYPRRLCYLYRSKVLGWLLPAYLTSSRSTINWAKRVYDFLAP